MDFSGENSVLLLLDDTKITSAHMINVIKTLLLEHKLCYITVAKTYDFVDKVLEEKEVDTGKIIYIDCISHSFRHTKEDPRAEFITSPSELIELTAAIKRALAKGYTSFLFDSISSLAHIVPAGSDAVRRLYDSFSQELKKKEGIMLFMCSVKDEEKLLIQESMPVYEKIIHLGTGDSPLEGEEADNDPL